MFEALSERFDTIFKGLRGKGKLRDSDVDEVLREIRIALLEADVNIAVVGSFRDRVRDRAVGSEVHKALNPAQQIVKIVHEELIATLGGETMPIGFADKPPTVLLMAGLQGAGKTTASAKLALWFKSQGRHPLLVGADLQRPAAVEQLRTLGDQIQVPVFSESSDPVEVAKTAVESASAMSADVVIVDTAGRLSIDEELMEQVADISRAVQPHYTFLVIDAMTGQDAVNTAESFHQTLALDGVILTKLDGDARGGAALSVKEVVGRPIAFASTGEKLEDFEQFHPDRLAGRILGMGDMLTLIEKAEEAFDEKEAEQTAARMLEGDFTLDDFLDQMQKLKKMGPLSNLLGLMPGLPKELKGQEVDDGQVRRVEAIIRSMTQTERSKPEIIDASRRSRIATGSGTKPQDVSQLVTQFKQMQTLLKRMGGLGSKRGMKKAKGRSKSKGASARNQRGNPSSRVSSRVTPKKGSAGSKKLSLPSIEDFETNEQMAELLKDFR